MRYLTLRVRHAGGEAFHPLGAALSADPTFEREVVHRLDLLADGTVLLHAEGSGNRSRYETVMAESPHVRDFVVAGEDRWHAVSQFEPTPLTRRLVERRRTADVTLEPPAHIEDAGTMRATFVGSESGLRELYRGVVDDDELAAEVCDTGDYDPDDARLARVLTGRQQEVLEAAVGVGYYRCPRAATLETVADELDVTPSTAGEHLRKIEARVFRTAVGDLD